MYFNISRNSREHASSSTLHFTPSNTLSLLFHSDFKRSHLDWTSGYNLTINLPRTTGDILFPILDWMSRNDIIPVLSSLILAVNLEKMIQIALNEQTNASSFLFDWFIILFWRPSSSPQKNIIIAYVYVHKYRLRLLMSSLKDQHLVLLS